MHTQYKKAKIEIVPSLIESLNVPGLFTSAVPIWKAYSALRYLWLIYKLFYAIIISLQFVCNPGTMHCLAKTTQQHGFALGTAAVAC